MKQRKTIKQLMALGISRNDASGFVSTYNKLSAQNRQRFLQEVVFEMSPVIPRKNEKIVSFAVRQVVLADDPFNGHLPPEVRENMVKKRMLDELCEGLVHSRAVSIEERQYDTYGGWTEIIAKIRVVEP